MEFGWIICSVFVQVPKVAWAAMGIGAVVAILYFKIFFRSWDDFQDAWSDFWRGLFRRQFAPRRHRHAGVLPIA
jgi:hypothetical protein